MKPDPNRSGQDTVDDEDKSALSLGEVIGSVLAAGFGVQSSKNRERDYRFYRGRGFCRQADCGLCGMITLWLSAEKKVTSF